MKVLQANFRMTVLLQKAKGCLLLYGLCFHSRNVRKYLNKTVRNTQMNKQN